VLIFRLRIGRPRLSRVQQAQVEMGFGPVRFHRFGGNQFLVGPGEGAALVG
jgi:hypothetical protein